MKNKHAHRAPFVAASIPALFLLFNGAAHAAIEPPDLGKETTALKEIEWNVMDILIDTYGDTDWSQVTDHVVSHPDDAGNPNVMVIPISLANGYLNRYEKSKNVSDWDFALLHLEWVAGKYSLWQKRWLTPGVIQYLVVSADRLRKYCRPYYPLPHPGAGKRVERLWKKVLRILDEEARFRLTVDLPYAPYDSCATGDSKAEENAWEAALFATAANFVPDASVSRASDARARQLAYHSITRPSDLADASGIKTCTVNEDMTLSNHGLVPNPYYAGATLFLLSQGALTYRLTGRAIPSEFGHNVPELFEKYISYAGEDLSWTVPSDPEGDATLFPFAFDSGLESKAIARKAFNGYLWKATPKVELMGTGSDLWEAIQNSKVVFYYLMTSYLWHFSAPPECFEVRYKQPMIGVVQ